MLQTIVTAILPWLLPTLGTVLSGYAVTGIHLAVAWFKSKVAKDKFNNLLDVVDQLASIAVTSVSQTIVETAKKDGSWSNPALRAQALSEALTQLKAAAAGLLPALAKAGVTDINAFLTALIEAKVKTVKALDSAVSFQPSEQPKPAIYVEGATSVIVPNTGTPGGDNQPG
jgi:hypothetical protein